MFGSNVNSLGKTEKNQKVKEGECVFPFKYKRETHTKCYPTEKGDICATSTNEKGTLKTYGYCRKNKTLKKKKKLKIIDESSSGSKTMSSGFVDMPYNDAFISLLGKLEKLMVRKGEPMRARAYQKAQQSLMLYDQPITDVKQIADLKGIGKTILAKFQEYLDTGKLAAIEKEKENPMLIFTNIYGVGPKKAEELIGKGITTIAELRKHPDLLNDKQVLGLKYYEDIEKRIPRDEIKKYDTVLTKMFKELKFTDATMEIVGSYRRGAKDSGDIDIIMTDKEHNPELLSRFVGKLVDAGVVLHKLTDGKTKVLAIAILPGEKIARRVDFLYTRPDEYAFAVLYFTGSKIFNTVMRQRALDMGYTLNEHGIYHMVSGKKGARVEGSFPDEKSIFDFLNMKYKSPEERKDARSVVSGPSAVPSAVPKRPMICITIIRIRWF
jgi:DNA polymerase beta